MSRVKDGPALAFPSQDERRAPKERGCLETHHPGETDDNQSVVATLPSLVRLTTVNERLDVKEVVNLS